MADNRLEPLVLTGDERRILENWVRRRSTAQGLALRARIVLACAQGGSNTAVAARLGVSRTTVCKWRVRFVRDRLDGLPDEPRPGVPRTITDAQVEEVVVRTLEEVPAGGTHWSKRELARQVGISATSVHRIWRAFGLQPWPDANVVGIDVWPPSIDAALGNVQQAGLADRITIREQNVTDLDDTGAYDCAWFPTFFMTEPVLEAAMPRLFRSVQQGGWLVLGRMAPPPDPLAEATSALRTIRGGGAEFDAKHLTAALEGAGCTAVQVLPRQGPAPLEYVIGQRPTA